MSSKIPITSFTTEELKQVLPTVEDITYQDALNNIFVYLEKGQKAGAFSSEDGYTIHLSKIRLLDYIKSVSGKDKTSLDVSEKK